MRTFDGEIARKLKEAADSGELGRAKGYGKPVIQDPGWEATPPTLRMPMKILEDAGATPPEIAWFHKRAQLRVLLESTNEPAEREKLQHQPSELEQKIALRLESLRIRSEI